ncbi:hypothetical protein ANN_22920 [Periplaneta americana]|uniref:Uncharacterized protein n=1 Tax=Periplaneta americana TaxID=6978 RepID=A0ABQ8SKW1_PERAM|nr:hypothetical protein ANN_22920 [Periplaneta americana]
MADLCEGGNEPPGSLKASTMTVKDCKPGDATCAQDMDPFLSQDSENLLGRVLADQRLVGKINVIHDLKEMNINKWVNLVQDRERRKAVVEKAKIFY